MTARDQIIPRASNDDLAALLSMLGISPDVFATNERDYFRELRKLLLHNHAIQDQARVDRNSFRPIVHEFQTHHNIEENGLPGEETLWQLQSNLIQKRQIPLSKVRADIWIRPGLDGYTPNRDGYDILWMRSDASRRYRRLQQKMHDYGAIMTSGGTMRSLQSPVHPGRSPTSLHYLGLAFDLALPTGMRDPLVDPFIITREGGGWRVWARAKQGERRDLEAVVWTREGIETLSITSSVIDFTSLAKDHGFHPVLPGVNFPEEYIGAEWWHFQCEDVLKPWISQFGIEILAIAGYTQEDLASVAHIWDNRKLIYRRLHRAGGWS